MGDNKKAPCKFCNGKGLFYSGPGRPKSICRCRIGSIHWRKRKAIEKILRQRWLKSIYVRERDRKIKEEASGKE